MRSRRHRLAPAAQETLSVVGRRRLQRVAPPVELDTRWPVPRSPHAHLKGVEDGDDAISVRRERARPKKTYRAPERGSTTRGCLLQRMAGRAAIRTPGRGGARAI